MSTYVTLVNQLLRRLNEVALDSAGDGFATVKGVQALAKDSINNSIRHILQDGHEFPFLKTTYTQTLTALQKEYSFQSDFSTVDWDSFFLKVHSTESNEPALLKPISYEEYLQNYRVSDETNTTGAAPQIVYQTYEEKFGISPPPNTDYEVEYVYFSYPNDLSAYNDTAIIPSRFDHIVVDGAMMYMMRFRSNDNQAQIHQNNFEKGIKAMRNLLMDDKLRVRSTVIETSNQPRGFSGVTS
jgi:hypothetical protein